MTFIIFLQALFATSFPMGKYLLQFAPPFFSAFYAYLLFNERLSTKQWLGLSIGLLGMMPILISQSPSEASLGKFFNISIYELFLFISVSLHCYSWLLIQKLVHHKNYDTSIVNGVC